MMRRLVAVLCVCAVFGCAGGRSSSRADGAQAEEKTDDSNAPLEVTVQRLENAGPRKRIGILDFENATQTRGYYSRGTNDPIAIAVRDAVGEGLLKSGAFVVIDREQMKHVLGEQALGQTGAISAQSAAKVGQMLGLQALVTGKITDFQTKTSNSGFGGYFNSQATTYRARVTLKVIDATTGEVWAAESAEGTATAKSLTVMGGGTQQIDENLGKRALYRAVSAMLDKVVKLAAGKPWSGSVAKVNKGKVFITAGSDTNIPAGSTLVVRQLGEEITDPSTGAVIGREPGKVIGKLQIAEHVNEKLSLCVAVNGAGFNSGDMVAIDPTTPAPAK